jgi:hypothetical protein
MMRKTKKTFLIPMAVFAVVGVLLLSVSRAAVFVVSSQAEAGTIAGNAAAVADTAASGGQAVRFGSGGAGKRIYGVSVASDRAANLDAFEAAAGKRPTMIMDYFGFPFSADYPTADVAFAASRGAALMLTWEPYDYRQGPVQSQYALRTFLQGAHDAYITRWAQQVKADGRTVYLRFAHEMNGNWYPWGVGVNGNQPGEYAQVWRRIHDIFRNQGVKNVIWVWSPNIAMSDASQLAGLYPGDQYVDWVGVDGYNGGSDLPAMGGWRSFETTMKTTFQQVRTFTQKPLMIAETGSSEHGGDKAAWITDMFAKMDEYETSYGLRGFVWFNHNKETDWRIQSSPGAQAAFRAGVSSPKY